MGLDAADLRRQHGGRRLPSPFEGAVRREKAEDTVAGEDKLPGENGRKTDIGIDKLRAQYDSQGRGEMRGRG